MTSLTSEESKQRYIDAMGQELGIIFHALSNELAWLYEKWNEYIELYGTKSSRINLINQAAGLFFKIVQDTLWENILLHITRITDREATFGHENLTIQRLANLIDKPDCKIEVEVLVEEVNKKVDFCRDWRNRRIAHNDLKLALRSEAESLMPANREKVNELLNLISEVLNTVTGFYTNSTTAFEGIGTSRGALTLLYVVDDGLKAQKVRQEKRKSGSTDPKDFPPRDI
jgi:hypothetical protein